MTTHQHPLTLLKGSWLISAAIACAILWVLYHPHFVVATFHITSTTPGLWIIDLLFGRLKLYLVAMAIVFPLASFLGTYTWWVMSTYSFDNNILTYQFGPFNRNQIPSGKIQDVRCEQDALGAMFGYGTLFVDAGRAEQHLPYVPDVKAWQDALLHAI